MFRGFLNSLPVFGQVSHVLNSLTRTDHGGIFYLHTFFHLLINPLALAFDYIQTQFEFQNVDVLWCFTSIAWFFRG